MLIALSKAARSRGLALTYDSHFVPMMQILHELSLRMLVRRALIVAAHRTGAARADALIRADFEVAQRLASED